MCDAYTLSRILKGVRKMKKSEEYKMHKRYLIFIIIIMSMLVIGVPLQLSAKVTGVCSNCHTMHNSQDGDAVNAGGSLDNLIKLPDDSAGSADVCVGCHSSTTAETIINSVPIVYNTTEPTTPLAGGNFHWVAAGDDSKGHNVYGLASPDSLTEAPGKNPAGCGTAGSCHYTLATAPSESNYNRGGCRGCHVFTYHHEDNGVYRFLKGHDQNPDASIVDDRRDIITNPDYVTGVEDDDWEYTTNNTGDHNYYKGTDEVYSSSGIALKATHSITAFCSGCHGVFHGPLTLGEGMGGSSPWRRHPTDIQLPDEGEYGGYDPDVDANYSTLSPVAWLDPENPTRSGAIVMCLSCHRPHGSDQPDLLRWAYGNCVAGTSNSNCGCFNCHTEKDGS